MKTLLLLVPALFLLISSQQTYAQAGAQTENVDIRMSKEQAIKNLDYAKKIKSEQKKIEKEQKKLADHQKDVQRSEKNVAKTQKKIAGKESENQSISAKINDQDLSGEKKQKLKIKSSKKELEIQELKLELIEQQKELDHLKADF